MHFFFQPSQNFSQNCNCLKERPDIVYFYQIEPDPLNACGKVETTTKMNFDQKLKEFKPKQVWVCWFVTQYYKYLNSVFTPAR